MINENRFTTWPIGHLPVSKMGVIYMGGLSKIGVIYRMIWGILASTGTTYRLGKLYVTRSFCMFEGRKKTRGLYPFSIHPVKPIKSTKKAG